MQKTQPGMIIESAKWNVDLNKSLMVGDTMKDLKAAQNANIRFILMNGAHNKKIIYEDRVNDLTQILNRIKEA